MEHSVDIIFSGKEQLSPIELRPQAYGHISYNMFVNSCGNFL